MNIKKILGSNIAKYRKTREFTQEELSEKLDISPKHLSNIERGKDFVSASILEKISEILNVTPSALFYSPELNKIDDNSLSKIDDIITEQAEFTKKRIR
ncbi:MAG: helix-turn-helix domain-containing protein, partial [Candidatus Thorarchaeota archaeon]